MSDKDSCYTCQSSELFENPVPYTDGINGGELCGYCNKNDGHYRIFLPGGKCKDFKSKEENEVSEELQEIIDSNPEWYKHLQYKDVKIFIQSNINNVSMSFVAIGYYLKYVRDNQLYKEDGYTGISEFAKAEFGISPAQASKFISINDRFSKDGNSPILLERYREFSSSKLSEMLYLTDEQLEQVTVATTNVEIREIKNPVKKPDTFSVPKTDPEHKACKFDSKKICYSVCNASVGCCGECAKRDNCNVACCTYPVVSEPVTYQPEYIESVTETEETVNDDPDEVIPERDCHNCNYDTMSREDYFSEHSDAKEFPCDSCGDFGNWESKTEKPSDDESLPCDTCGREIQGCCDYPDAQDDYCVEGDKWIPIPEEAEPVETLEADIIQTEPEKKNEPLFSEKYHMRELIKREEDTLREMRESWAKNNPDALRKHELMLLAYKSFMIELEYPNPEPVKPEQPELPILKNNDQRKDFIDAYETWPIWIDLKETGERYYRYNLTDKIAMVVKVSLRHIYEGYKESKKIGFVSEQYYLIGIKTNYSTNNASIFQDDPARMFYECSSNKSSLVDYLKYFQKKGA